MSDLVERLRRVEGTRTQYFRNPDGPEAADEIERLEREIEHLKEALAVTDYERLKAVYGNA